MARSIFALVAAILAIGIFVVYTKPTYDSTDAIQADIAQYNQALDKSTQLLQKKQQLMTRFNSFDSNSLDRLQKLLPDHVDNVALILDLDSLASRYGMGLENVDISTPASQSVSNSKTTTIAGATTQKFDSLTLKFTTRGTYENFRQFLTSLEQSLRIVDLTALSITPDATVISPVVATSTPKGAKNAPPPPPVVPQQVYKYDITVRTYWLK